MIGVVAVVWAVLSAPDATFLATIAGGVIAVFAQSRSNGRKLEEVRAETRTNGGSTMRDDLVHVKNAAARLEGAIEGLYHRHDRLDDRLTAVEETLTRPERKEVR
jgi:hypothetical protein